MAAYCQEDLEMQREHIERLTRLEERVDNHEESLKNLVPSVAAIEGHLKAIKWTAIGGVLFLAVQKYGLLAAIEKFVVKVILVGGTHAA